MAGPVDESKNQLPDILCVIQVCIFSIDHTIFLLHFLHMACLIGLASITGLALSVLSNYDGEIVDLFLVM